MNGYKSTAMYPLNCGCFICLKDNNLQTVLQKNEQENEISTLFKYVLPEFTTFDPDIPLRICSKCHKILHSFFVFKKLCLDKYNRLIQNTKILCGTSDTQDNNEPFIKQEIEEEIEDTSLPREDQEDPKMTVDSVGDIVNVKEEIDAPEDNSDQYFYQELVKCETVSVNAQDCGSNLTSDDENQLNTFDTNYNTNTDSVHSIYDKYYSPENFYLSQNIKGQTSDAKYNCSICNITFLDSLNFTRHMKEHSAIKIFECSVCNKQFSRNYGLKVHMNMHAGIKNVIECSVCYKQYTRNYQLKQHMKTHAGIKDFECSLCFKQFSRNDTLKQHMKIHEGSTEVDCTICNKKFTKNGYLRQHMKIHENIECYICKEKFIMKAHLKYHMKTHFTI